MSVIDDYTGGGDWQDILKFGVTKVIDSEIGNPSNPAPRQVNTPAETQILTTDTGKGTVSVKKGSLPYFNGMTNSMKIAASVAAVVVGFYVLKKVF